jgi:hypothetical protein
VPDLQRTAARLLRLALGTGAAFVSLGVALDAAGLGGPGGVAGGIGVGVVVAAPFATLIAIAVVGRRTGTALYAIASLGLALLGLFLAA